MPNTPASARLVRHPRADKRSGRTRSSSRQPRPAKGTSKRRVAEDEDANHSQLFLVEAVRDVRLVRGARQYLVKWAGYGEAACTWEPERYHTSTHCTRACTHMHTHGMYVRPTLAHSLLPPFLTPSLCVVVSTSPVICQRL